MSFEGGLNFTLDIIALDDVNKTSIINYDQVYNKEPLATNVKARACRAMDSVNGSLFYFVTNRHDLDIPNGSLLINTLDRENDQYIVINTITQYGYSEPHHQNIYTKRRKIGKFHARA